MYSPTQLSLRHLRELGYTVQVVETFNCFTKRKSDLFQFIDILALRGDETLAVQTTSKSNISARVKKIADNEHVGAVRDAGWRIHCHGWAKNKSGRWEVKVVDLS